MSYEELFWKSEDIFFGNFVAYNIFDVDEKLIKEIGKFQEAIREELRAMEIYKTWEFVPRPIIYITVKSKIRTRLFIPFLFRLVGCFTI